MSLTVQLELFSPEELFSLEWHLKTTNTRRKKWYETIMNYPIWRVDSSAILIIQKQIGFLFEDLKRAACMHNLG